ncbi:uncharacterized protein LOC136042064 isoform X1 [Artemia franciscana]|uniref:uncharacterized protein LOC136042064 isoform X1 n=1 Tax=Artemia franciscana TaxID=6661 RepID=UPI0032DA0692
MQAISPSVIPAPYTPQPDVSDASRSPSLFVTVTVALFPYQELFSRARYFIELTTFGGVPIGLAMLSGGASIVVYHHQRIPLIRRIVERLNRLGYDQVILNVARQIWEEVIIGTGNDLLAQLVPIPRFSIFLHSQ